MTLSLLWFRQDLRLADNPGLTAALAEGAVLPVFVLDDAAAGPHRAGGASRWWLRQSLARLREDLAARGAPLILARGTAEIVLTQLMQASGASRIHAMRAYEPWARAQSRRVHEATAGALTLHTSAILREPHGIVSGSGKPYAVYTPFARTLFALGAPPPPLPAPPAIATPAAPPAGETLERLGLYPVPGEPDWAAGFGATWQPGEAGAAIRLARFTARALSRYGSDRNLPAIEGSSGLSPHLHWGEISPGQVWHAAASAGADGGATETFLKEILWREFSYHLLWHRPDMPEAPLRADFAAFPWREDARALSAWQRGQTGYPIVDAGMRQLWQTGWMHNRVRMIVASFLVKHLLLPWQAGAQWFWDTLLDADLASNSASWQWVAGCGTDAAPYFRVFNPVLQGRKFDPEGAYVRRFVPELAHVPNAAIHAPWEMPGATPRDYPGPIVDHAAARARALAAFAAIRAA